MMIFFLRVVVLVVGNAKKIHWDYLLPHLSRNHKKSSRNEAALRAVSKHLKVAIARVDTFFWDGTMRSNKNWETLHTKWVTKILFQVKVCLNNGLQWLFLMNELCELLLWPVVHLADPITQKWLFEGSVWSHGRFQSKHRCLGDLWAAKGVEWTCSCEIHEWVWGHVESQHWRSREFLGWDGEAILLANTFWKGGPWVQLWSQSRSNLSEMVSGRQDQLILQLFGSKYWTRSGI